MECHCVKLFGVVHFCLCIEGNWIKQGNGTKVVLVKIMNLVSHYTALFICKRASNTIQGVGKFWNLHNPQKLCMRQITYIKAICFIFRKIIYVNRNKVGSIVVRGNLSLKAKFCISTNSVRRTNSPHFLTTQICKG